MICLDMQERLSAYLDGDLSPEEAEEVSTHLRDCEVCQTVLSELRQVRDELRSLPEVDIPANLHSAIMQNLEPHLKPKKRRLFGFDFRNWGYRQWVPVAAAMMVFIMVFSIGGTLWYTGRFRSWGFTGVTADEGPAGSAKMRSKIDEVNTLAAPPVASPEAAEKGLMMAAPSYGTDGTGAGAEPLLDTARKIIRRAQLAVEVSRGGVKPAADLAVNVVQSNFGYVESSSISGSDSERKEATSFFMVARVPATNLDRVVQDLSALGTATREDISAQDVTDTYIDLDARLRNKENQEARLLQIMGEAKTVGELLQVEGELSRVRGDIESMRAQKQSYDKAVDLSSVTLTISEEGTGRSRPPSRWAEVWRVFVEAWRDLAVFLARIAPALTVMALAAAGGIWVVRRRKA